MLEKYNSLAKKKHNEHKLYLKKLKTKKPKGLDMVVQDTHNEVFDSFNCLDCANCCKTTGPLFTEKDIERLAKHFNIRPKSFISEYLHKDEDEDWVLNKLPCSFLDDENKCTVYDIRPKACKEYPHTDRKKLYQINHLTIKNTKICPAAYLVVEKLQEKLPL